MDAENASLGDERRARREEYGHGRPNSESRGFAGFGSPGSETANGSHGATNRPESVPDRGYTWTPAPLSTPNPNQHHTGGSAALDPFAAWSNPGAGGAAPRQPDSPGDHSDTAYPLPPTDGPPREPDGPATDTLPARSRQTEPPRAPGQADSAALPQISQPGRPSSGPMPAPGDSYPVPADEATVPAGGPQPPLSGAATAQLPQSEPDDGLNGVGIALSTPGDPATYRPLAEEAEAFPGPTSDTGPLPSWLSSIGEEPVPQVESGGRRRKPDLTEPAESDDQFNPFDDQHPTAQPEPAEQYESPADPGHSAQADASTPALPTRAPRDRSAAPGAEEADAAPPPLPARRLPRSAARRAAAGEDATAGPAPDSSTNEAGEFGAAESGPAPELPARRLPRSASRYSPDSDTDTAASRTSAPDPLTAPNPLTAATADPDVDSGESGSSADERGAPARLTPPADNNGPILDRLLDPEPTHPSTASDEEPGAPVAQILSRILESEPDSESGSRLTQPTEPAAEPPTEPTHAPAESHRSTGSPLTLVPDAEPARTASEHSGADESRPPLETRRSRRAREAAEAEAPPAADRPEPVAGQLPPAASGSGRGGDAGSRHSRSEEGADIDIHLIMRLLTASDDLEVLAGQADAGEVSTAEVARAAREARAAVLSAVSAWYGGPAQMVKFANALLQAANES